MRDTRLCLVYHFCGEDFCQSFSLMDKRASKYRAKHLEVTESCVVRKLLGHGS